MRSVFCIYQRHYAYPREPGIITLRCRMPEDHVLDIVIKDRDSVLLQQVIWQEQLELLQSCYERGSLQIVGLPEKEDTSK